MAEQDHVDLFLGTPPLGDTVRTLGAVTAAPGEAVGGMRASAWRRRRTAAHRAPAPAHDHSHHACGDADELGLEDRVHAGDESDPWGHDRLRAVVGPSVYDFRIPNEDEADGEIDMGGATVKRNAQGVRMRGRGKRMRRNEERILGAHKHFAAADYERCLRAVRDMIHDDPTFSDAYELMGMVHEMRGEHVAAFNAYWLSAIVNARRDPAAQRQVYESAARVAEQAEAWDHMQECYMRLVMCNAAQGLTEQTFAQYKRGVAWARMGCFVDALRCLHNVLRVDPTNVLALAECANVYVSVGRHDLARRHAEEYVRVWQERTRGEVMFDIEVLSLLISLCFLAADYDGVVRWAGTFQRTNGVSTLGVNASAHVAAALLYRGAGGGDVAAERARADVWLERVVAGGDGDAVDAVAVAAEACVRTGHAAMAGRLLAAVETGDDMRGELALVHALAAEAAGDKARAVACAQRAVRSCMAGSTRHIEAVCVVLRCAAARADAQACWDAYVGACVDALRREEAQRERHGMYVSDRTRHVDDVLSLVDPRVVAHAQLCGIAPADGAWLRTVIQRWHAEPSLADEVEVERESVARACPAREARRAEWVFHPSDKRRNVPVTVVLPSVTQCLSPAAAMRALCALYDALTAWGGDAGADVRVLFGRLVLVAVDKIHAPHGLRTLAALIPRWLTHCHGSAGMLALPTSLPSAVRAQCEEASAHMAAGRVDEGLQRWWDALEAAPTVPRVCLGAASAHVLAACTRSPAPANEDMCAAVALLQRHRALTQPDCFPAVCSLAMALHQAGMVGRAFALYDEALLLPTRSSVALAPCFGRSVTRASVLLRMLHIAVQSGNGVLCQRYADAFAVACGVPK